MSVAERPARRGRRRVYVGLGLALLAVAGLAAYPATGYLRGSWHWKKARAAIAARDFRVANEHLEACRRQWPDSAEVAFASARNARQAGDVKAARSLLADARRLNWAPDQLALEAALLDLQTGRDFSHVGRL